MNSFFDWAASITRFVKKDTARAEEVNDALDGVSLGFEEVEALTNAAIKLPAGETSAALGNAAARKGKVLTFNSTTGAAETPYTIADVATVSGVAANVTTVAGIAANVTTVAGISGNVTTVATNNTNVTTVAGISGNVTTVAGISADVTTVATNNANVSTVATNIANVNTVGGISGNVTTVAGIQTNVTTVAGVSAAVTTVATNNVAVSTVATNIASVNTAATNIAAIIAAPTEASNAATSASNALASETAAAASATALTGTSATSLTPSLAEKVVTTQTGKSFGAGTYVMLVSNSDAAVWMYGPVTSYSGSTLTFTPTAIGTASVKADWTIAGRVGARGATGTGITEQATGFTATGGTTPKTLTVDDDLTTAQAARRNAANTFTAQQTFAEVKDTVYTITDGAAFEIDPANGSIQVVTLGASRTPAATNFEAGQTVLLGIDDGTAYSVTWTTVAPTWVKVGGTGAAPTLAATGYTWIILTKVGTTIFASEWGQP